MSRRISWSRRDGIAAMSLTLLCSAAGAQADKVGDKGSDKGTLEEVVVTAQKRVESLQNVPLAISAISGDKLAEAGINKVEDLKNYAPSLVMAETVTGNNISMRGVFSGTNRGFEQSVGTFVDGLYHGRGQQARAPFLDLERVEVLRGSQSILFGKNSVAGSLNITTARPTDTFQGSLSALYEPEYDEQVYAGVLSGPLTDRLRGRIAARYREYGGNVENLTLGRNEGQKEESTVRGWLEFDLTDDVELAFKAEAGSFDTVGRSIEVVNELPSTRPGPFNGLTYSQILSALGADPSVLNNVADDKRSANTDESAANDTHEYEFVVDWHIGDHQLTAISGYSAYETGHDRIDPDITGANVFAWQDNWEKFDQWSQEIRLASPTEGRFEYLAGAYWETTDMATTTSTPIVAGTLIPALLGPAGALVSNTDSLQQFDQSSETYAVFARASWNISESWRANAGLRWSQEDKEATRSLTLTDLNGTPLTGAQEAGAAALYAALLNRREHDLHGSRSEDHMLPSLSVEYEFADDKKAYASWSKGAKSGGYDTNSTNPVPLGSFEFQPEKADNYEIGTKMTFGGTLEVNLDVFYTEFKDMQVSTFDGLGFNVRNAAAATTQGVELDSRWQATRNLFISASVAYTDFEYRDFAGQCYTGKAPDAPDGVNCLYNGKPNQFVADWVGSVSGDYRIPIGDRFELRTVVDAYYTGDYFAASTLDPRQKQEAYTKLNGQLSFGSAEGTWNLALVGKNLTDKRIMPYGTDTPLAYGLFGAYSAWRTVEPGRSIALQGTWRF